MQHIFIF